MILASTVKNCFKFLVCVVIYTVVYIIVNAFMPYSQEFMEANIAEHRSAAMMLLMLVPIFWNCFAAYFIIKNTHFNGTKLFVRLLFVMFFVMFFITYIGAMYSLIAFEGNITALDFLFTMIAGLISLLVTIPIMIKFFQNKNEYNITSDSIKNDFKATVVKLGLCGITYFVAYFIFAFFFQWRFEVFRNFYSSTQWGQTAWGGNISGLFPFLSITFIRGILNGIFILPLVSMITQSKYKFVTAICLVCIAPAMNHIPPNPIFPDTVRLVHLGGMTGTMLLFSLVAGNILWSGKTHKEQ